MSDYNELYIHEEATEFVEKKLDKIFGKGLWRLDGYSNIAVRSQMVIPILDNADFFDDDLLIGVLYLKNKAELEEDTYGNECFEYSPKKILCIIKGDKVVFGVKPD